MPARKTSPSALYQIKVTLKRSKPPIWRRIQVSGDLRLDQLHRVLQTVMGWGNCHLHQFTAGGRNEGEPHPDYGLDMEDERKVTLGRVATREGAKLTYEYDFGDSWEHELLIEKILPPAADARSPICLAGKRNCPPEDCG